ncbi:TetR family transcriptional regulator [Stackebrandtia albiflava]|uniref:TetR family transcriptional regulator n=1 Tax=Stackebrandtia albiflava TaxID=406432 RepID=A0A562V328_9ACTN|nr:TetR/AcrR family transcriptional regulator [Stackebrandtia albiflava]TWJ12222.1 TetR family transcriptional regulator [Stackebrandtia albiflava]
MPNTHPGTDRGREVRRRLLATAAELIAELGWTAVSTRVLAARAGVRPGLVHYHFANLPALLREAAMTDVRRLLADTETGLDGLDPERAVAEILTALDAYTGHDPASLLMTETFLAATRDPELHRELRAAVHDFRRRVTDLLARHRVPEPAATAAVLLAAFDGIVIHKALDPALDAHRTLPVFRRLIAAATGDETEEDE